MPVEEPTVNPRLKYIDSDRSSEADLVNKKQHNYNLNYNFQQSFQQQKKQQLKLSLPLHSPPPPAPSEKKSASSKKKKTQSKFLLDEISQPNSNTSRGNEDPNSYYSFDHQIHTVMVEHPTHDSKVPVQNTTYMGSTNGEKQQQRRKSITSTSSKTSATRIHLNTSATKESTKEAKRSSKKHRQQKIEYTNDNMKNPMSEDSNA